MLTEGVIIMMKRTAAFIAGLMMITGACTGCAAPVQNTALGAELSVTREEGREPSAAYTAAQMKFGTELFKHTYSADSGRNVLVSPFSVYTALAMTSNGAAGESLESFRQLLGGGMEISDINEYTAAMINRLNAAQGGEVNVLDSVWFRDDSSFKVNTDFVRDIGSWYGAEAFKASFTSETVEQINKWTDKGTNGMIEKLIDDPDEFDEDTVMVLINTLYFRCGWAEEYTESHRSSFTAADGTVSEPETLFGTEDTYFDGDGYTGFSKPYKGGFSFVGLLPDEGTDIDNFIASLDSQELADTLANPGEGTVITSMPELSLDYDNDLLGIVSDMGLDSSGLENIAAPDSPSKEFAVSKIIHKTKIDLNKTGIEAAAATAAEICKGEAALPSGDIYYVYLNRPYVYMIVDDATGLPLFMGAVRNI